MLTGIGSPLPRLVFQGLADKLLARRVDFVISVCHQLGNRLKTSFRQKRSSIRCTVPVSSRVAERAGELSQRIAQSFWYDYQLQREPDRLPSSLQRRAKASRSAVVPE